MRNITKEIKQAISQNIPWSISLFYEFIESVQNRNIDVSYWDGEENWATLIINERPVGFVWKKYPVLFIRGDIYGNFEEELENRSYLISILVDDLNAEVLKLNHNVLKDYLEFGVDYRRFSATDLWFQTNSI